MSRPDLLALLVASAAIGCGEKAQGDTARAATDGGRAGTIVVDESIGPVRIGMTTADVHRALGQPDRVGPSGLHAGWERWRYRERRLTLTVTETGEVWDVRTRSPRYRSQAGLRVGLREREIRRRLPGAECGAFGGPARYRRWRVCTSGSEVDGPFTRVLIIGGLARKITIARGLAM